MSCDKEDVSPKLDIVLIAPRETGARQWHLLNEHGEAVAGGGQVQLQVAFKLLPPCTCWQYAQVNKLMIYQKITIIIITWQQTRVEGEHTDHLLLHIDPRLASIGIACLVKSEKRTSKIKWLVRLIQPFEHLSWTKFVQQTITKPVICHHHQHKADILLGIVKFISIKICQNVPSCESLPSNSVQSELCL